MKNIYEGIVEAGAEADVGWWIMVKKRWMGEWSGKKEHGIVGASAGMSGCQIEVRVLG
jgi:hypothetical protein